MNLKKQFKNETGEEWLIKGDGLSVIINEEYVEWLEQRIKDNSNVKQGKMTKNNKPLKNTDTELFREVEGDHYSPSLHKTELGGIGIDVGGYVIVRSLRSWHELDQKNEKLESENQRLKKLLREYLDGNTAIEWNDVPVTDWEVDFYNRVKEAVESKYLPTVIHIIAEKESYSKPFNFYQGIDEKNDGLLLTSYDLEDAVRFNSHNEAKDFAIKLGQEYDGPFFAITYQVAVAPEDDNG